MAAFSLSQSAAMLHLILYRTVTFMVTAVLANCITPPFLWTRCARLSTYSHRYSIHLSFARVNHYIHGKLCNILPHSVFPFLSSAPSREKYQGTKVILLLSKLFAYF